ncbi:energy transducer TonB [Phenylobacterium sp.]|uniref:energy transducer TonB n=1 Tax=Phenylobacterium sp. TaxID=1871053 RepID=UPI00289E467B|nr:energy transducer TonB [Phenylobacterium sp.]
MASLQFAHGAHGFDQDVGRRTPDLRRDQAPTARRRRRGGIGVQLAILGSLVLHGALGVYLWKARFEPRYREYVDEVTSVELIKPLPPPPAPPPPPPPPPPARPEPPPKLQPRPPAAVRDLPRTIPPLPVPPVERRVEEPRPPPVVVVAPPPPPVAAPPAPRAAVIQNPDWLRLPSGQDIARYYPDRAQRMNVEGRAVLGCTVTSNGALENCRVVSEEPADQGFGEAAMKMSRLFRMRPMTRDGEPVAGGAVRIPIRFVLPKG